MKFELPCYLGIWVIATTIKGLREGCCRASSVLLKGCRFHVICSHAWYSNKAEMNNQTDWGSVGVLIRRVGVTQPQRHDLWRLGGSEIKK